MNLDEVKRQFVEEIKLRAYDDKYVDKDEEREILQKAIQLGVSVDSARAALAQVCDSNNYILESKVLSEIKDLIDTFASNDGKIDAKRALSGIDALVRAGAEALRKIDASPSRVSKCAGTCASRRHDEERAILRAECHRRNRE